jgi:uncharacterized LabA/DUF88 family protein
MDGVPVFVDAEFLKREGAKALRVHPPVRVDAPAAIRYLRSPSEALTQHRFLRAYWYDAEYPREHPQFEKQQTYVRAISNTPGLTWRLGKIKAVTPSWLHALRRALERASVDQSLSND